MRFDHQQSTEIVLTTALYAAGIEKKCKLPDRTWALGTGAFLRFELLERRGDMLKGQIAPILCYKAIASIAAQVPRDRIDAQSMAEIQRLLIEARRCALTAMQRHAGDLREMHRKAALSIQKDLHVMRMNTGV